jgi:Tol biopolymer transport system component
VIAKWGVLRKPMLKQRAVILFLLLVTICVGSTMAQSRVDRYVDELPNVRSIEETAISPDGARVAYIVNGGLHIESLSAEGKGKSISPSGDLETRDLAWSPDGKRLAYVANKPHSQASQVWVADAANGKPKQITNVTGYVSTLRWSPEGSKLAFLFIENAKRIAGPLEPMTPDAGVVQQHIEEQRIAVVDANGGSVKQISPADLYVYEYPMGRIGPRSQRMVRATTTGGSRGFTPLRPTTAGYMKFSSRSCRLHGRVFRRTAGILLSSAES